MTGEQKHVSDMTNRDWIGAAANKGQAIGCKQIGPSMKVADVMLWSGEAPGQIVVDHVHADRLGALFGIAVALHKVAD